MEITENRQYTKMISSLYEDFPYWDRLDGKTVLLSGASGMIGSLLTDAIMLRNRTLEKPGKLIALGRSRETAEKRFAQWMGSPDFAFLAHDICEPLPSLPWRPDYFIHGASTTHPVAYASEPVNTILANILGTHSLLEAASEHAGSRFLLLSSVEVYGENRGDAEYFQEDYCGYLDCNTLRAGYPEGKRVSEAMCQAYIKEKGVDAVIIRLPRCYGPTMRMSDTKAISQFIKKGLAGEDIVLKSEGNQFYSYAFAADAVLGLLYVLTGGACGAAYNLADSGSDITLKELAGLVAGTAGSKVVFELPSETERAGYSTATRAVMRGERLKALGWKPRYDIKTGIQFTIGMLRNELGI